MPETPTKPNFLERAIAAVAPSYALERAVSKSRLMQFGYDGANAGTQRRSANIHENGSPETWKTNRERKQLIAEARELERNVCLVSGTFDNMLLYSMGRMSYQSSTGSPEIDRAYQDYFHDWCKRCDKRGVHTFRKMMALALRGVWRDGDTGIALSRDIPDRMSSELRLNLIEADRIGHDQDGMSRDDLMGGVRMDSEGKRIGYRIYKRTVTNMFEFQAEETPQNFIFLYDPKRADQVRGISGLAQAIPHLRDLYEMFGYEKTAAKFSAMWSAFIEETDPLNRGAAGTGGFDTAATSTTPATMEAQPGRIQRLDANTRINFHDGPQRPSGAFMEFCNTLIREIALGLNLPYGFVYDMSILGGATARIDVMRAQRVFQYWQRFMEDNALNRIKDLVLSIGIARREIPAHPSYKSGRWHYGAWITADTGYQTQSDIGLIQMGLKSRTQWCEENDFDFDVLEDSNVKEVLSRHDKAVQYKVPEELLPGGNPMASQLWSAINLADDPAALAAQQAAQAPPPPPPGLIGTVGDKGIKWLTDLAEKVGQGMIDRESAIMQVMAAFQMTYEQAALLMPQGVQPAGMAALMPKTPQPSNTSRKKSP